MLKRLFFGGVLCAPVTAWAFIKPIQVIAAEWNGGSCINDTTITDDMTHSPPLFPRMEETLAHHIGVAAAGFVNPVFSFHDSGGIHSRVDDEGFK